LYGKIPIIIVTIEYDIHVQRILENIWIECECILLLHLVKDFNIIP